MAADQTKTFIVDCPECKAKVAAIEEGCAERTYFDDDASEPVGNRLLVGSCPRCKTLLAASSRQTSFEGFEGDEYDNWSDPVRVFPHPPKAFVSFRIPPAVSISLAEGNTVLQANAPIAACAMFGRALEAVCRDLLFTAEEKKDIASGKSVKRLMLAAGIKQLHERNIIDARLYDWSQHLHAFRNLAAHPDFDTTSISRQDAEDLKTFVHAIIEYIYDLADRYDAFKARQLRITTAKRIVKPPTTTVAPKT